MGTSTNHKFDQATARIQKGLASPGGFETAQVELGELLGFHAGNSEDDAAPDPWWLGESLGIVFESHAGGDASTVFGATKARQASGHPKWLKRYVDGTEDMEILPVLVTPCSKAKSGADPHLDEVRYWPLSEFCEWASRAISVLRELKGTLPGEGDLIWRSEVAQRLEAESLTLRAITERLMIASEAMQVVD